MLWRQAFTSFPVLFAMPAPDAHRARCNRCMHVSRTTHPVCIPMNLQGRPQTGFSSNETAQPRYSWTFYFWTRCRGAVLPPAPRAHLAAMAWVALGGLVGSMAAAAYFVRARRQRQQNIDSIVQSRCDALPESALHPLCAFLDSMVDAVLCALLQHKSHQHYQHGSYEVSHKQREKAHRLPNGDLVRRMRPIEVCTEL